MLSYEVDKSGQRLLCGFLLELANAASLSPIEAEGWGEEWH